MRKLPDKKILMLLGVMLCLLLSCKSRNNAMQLKEAIIAQEKSCIFQKFGNEEVDSYSVDDSGGIDLYEWRIMDSHVKASSLAYEDDHVIRARPNDWGMKRVDVIRAGSMKAFVASNDRCVILAFRGTDLSELRDWLTDLKIRRERVEIGGIHRGFRKAWQDLSRGVVRALEAAKPENKVFWVTGHSLGGALAATFAWDLDRTPRINRRWRIDRIITFGQPLVGDADFAKYMRNLYVGRYFRVVNNKDIIATQAFWYTHFGSLIWFNKGDVTFNKDEAVYGGNPNQPPNVLSADIPEPLIGNSSDLDQLEGVLASMERQIAGQSPDLSGSQSLPEIPPTNGYGALPFIDRITDHLLSGYSENIQGVMFPK